MVTLWQARDVQAEYCPLPPGGGRAALNEAALRRRSRGERLGWGEKLGNLTVGNAKHPDKTGLAGVITHASVLYDQIVHRLSSFLPL